MKAGGGRRLAVALGLVAIAVLVQAVLAGQFLGGEDTRTAHTALGGVLLWYAIVPAVLAVRRRHVLPVLVWVGTALLPVLLWVQLVLGHVTWRGSTAIHVPLGVLLFGGSVQLTAAAMRADGSRPNIPSLKEDAPSA